MVNKVPDNQKLQKRISNWKENGGFGVSNAEDIRNHSSLVKITHNGAISVKCLNDSLQTTVLEKPFTVSISPKPENTA